MNHRLEKGWKAFTSTHCHTSVNLAVNMPRPKRGQQKISAPKTETGPPIRDWLKYMKIIITLILAALAITLTSCSTPRPPQAFHGAGDTALVIESSNDGTCQILQPTASGTEKMDGVLAKAMNLPKHEEAVIILENYNEPQFGPEFRDRGTAWFVGLRNLGYQRIIFLQGNGVANPEGLITLVEYE